MRTLAAVAVVALAATSAAAQSATPAKVEQGTARERVRSGVLQDPVKVDPAHYTLEYEDAAIRILRVRLEPGDTSVMHEHPKSICIVALTDEHTSHLLPDSSASETTHPAGTVECNRAEAGWYRHQPRNLSNTREEYLIIERKAPGYGRGLQGKKVAAKP